MLRCTIIANPPSRRHIGAGTIFRLGEQKLAENYQDNQIQNYNFIQYVAYFPKKAIYRYRNIPYTVYNRVRGKVFDLRIFVLKGYF